MLALTACGAAENAEGQVEEQLTVRVGSLKGPTSIGLVRLMEQSSNGETGNNYEFTMETAADALLGKMMQGELDIALVPANVASVLFHKTEGGISVIDINTLGVIYMVSADTSIDSMEDLVGKTVYLTGKGTTPDFALQYLLSANGISVDDVTLEYKSEATEVAAVLAENPDAVGLLPQPFVTAATKQNEALSVVLDMTEQWNLVQGEDGSTLVTGVTIVRNDFLAEHEAAVQAFLADHKASAEYANTETAATAELVVAQGIIEKAPVAEAAIPFCNIVYMDGEEMKEALSGYLKVLEEQNAEFIGGSVPEDGFYYIAK
ncbi:MAG: ABC transporter substrate-binding protein [Lachnospiraceae bacterium]